MTSPYHKTVLGNGIRVVSGPMTGVRSTSLILYYDVGSRYEDSAEAGISHYLEHMLFKGTSNRPDAKSVSVEIEGVGGILNASTSKEATNYWVKCPSTHFNLAYDILADMALNSLIDTTELDKERSVIIEEIRGSEDTPDEFVHEIIDEVVWGTHSVGRPIAGSEETVGDISRDRMIDFWHRNYSPDRMVVAAAGDLEHDHLVEVTEQHFGHLSANGSADIYDRAEVTQNEPQTRIERRDTEQAHLCIALPALPYTSERRYVQGTIESVLSSGMSSRLFQEIREKRGLVYSVYGYFKPYEDVGQGVVYAGTDLHRVEETITAILDEFRKLKDEPVPEDELNRTKELRKGRLLMAFEDSRSVASWVGSQELVYREIKTPEEVTEEIEAVTAEQVQELSQELFTSGHLNLAIIGPYDDELKFSTLLEV